MGVATSPQLLDVLRSRQAQANALGGTYAAAVAAPDAMLYWLARAAKQLREAAGRKQVHVAAEADKDQSSIYRFEQAVGWPRKTDRIVAAYAADLDVQPIEIWEMALQLWREDLDAGGGEIVTPPDKPRGPAAEAADAAEALAERARKKRDDTARGRRGQRRRPA